MCAAQRSGHVCKNTKEKSNKSTNLPHKYALYFMITGLSGVKSLPLNIPELRFFFFFRRALKSEASAATALCPARIMHVNQQPRPPRQKLHATRSGARRLFTRAGATSPVIGRRKSPSSPVAVKPCNAIRPRLHFNTVKVCQDSSPLCFFSPHLSPLAHLQGFGGSFIFSNRQSLRVANRYAAAF